VNFVNKYLGTPNLVVDGQPVDGRSGGGLFTADGRLIGVCNAADRQDDDGLYAALGAIRAELDRAGLDFIYRGGTSAGEASDRPPAAHVSGPNAPTGNDARPPAVAAPATTSNPSLPPLTDDAEVICIVRSGRNRHSRNEVIVLDQPSTAFMDQLTSEMRRHSSAQLTELRVNP
jgi:hypothetical protein